MRVQIPYAPMNKCGCSSVVEFLVANENVESSNLFTRSKQSVDALALHSIARYNQWQMDSLISCSVDGSNPSFATNLGVLRLAV